MLDVLRVVIITLMCICLVCSLSSMTAPTGWLRRWTTKVSVFGSELREYMGWVRYHLTHQPSSTTTSKDRSSTFDRPSGVAHGKQTRFIETYEFTATGWLYTASRPDGRPAGPKDQLHVDTSIWWQFVPDAGQTSPGYVLTGTEIWYG